MQQRQRREALSGSEWGITKQKVVEEDGSEEQGRWGRQNESRDNWGEWIRGAIRMQGRELGKVEEEGEKKKCSEREDEWVEGGRKGRRGQDRDEGERLKPEDVTKVRRRKFMPLQTYHDAHRHNYARRCTQSHAGVLILLLIHTQYKAREVGMW